MFDELMRMARKLERGVRVPIQLPLDDKECLDRQCPSAECLADFKVVFADWREKVHDDAVFCPVCRHEAPATEWNTPAQVKYIKKAAMAHVQHMMGKALRQDAERFNRSQPRGGFISMSMSYKPGPRPIAVPPEAADALRQDFACEACGCRYSSVGAAFFCPACGHNSARSTFTAAVQTVRAGVAAIPVIRQALADSADLDTAADAVRQVLENGVVKLVASFQRFAEASFLALPNASSFPMRRNLFQNLADSSQRWRDATGKGYEDLVAADELGELRVYFQQRHLLAHREGMVDQDYIDRSGDCTYSAGQRLVIKEAAVLRLAVLVDKLGDGIVRLVEASQQGP